MPSATPNINSPASPMPITTPPAPSLQSTSSTPSTLSTPSIFRWTKWTLWTSFPKSAPALTAALILLPSFFFLPSTPARAIAPRHAEMAKTVEIHRDEFGVPHILAPTEEAAAMGLGYAQAEDYPQLLPKLFAIARGEGAKYFGKTHERHDFLVKLLRLHEDTVERYGEVKPALRAILDAYAAGYNLWLAKQPEPRAPWLTPLTGPDVLAHGRVVVVLNFTLKINLFPNLPLGTARTNGNDSAAAAPALDGFALAAAEDGMTEGPGSNMWSIGKERAASGRGMLLANPHLSWSEDQIFYEAHLIVPGEVNLYGSCLIGNPGVTIGFNEHLGWSHTVNRFDSHDVMEMKDDPANPDHYLYDGLSLPYGKRELKVEVADKDGKIEAKTEPAWDTHFGPVMAVRNGKKYALKSPNLKELGMLEQWRQMGRSKNLAEFKAALNLQGAPMFNICYADREGNAFYIFNARIPQRPGGYDWAGIVPGDTSKADWTVVHPVAELPQITNPAGGYTQNCNDAPWYANLRQIIDKSKFPDYMSKDFLGFRSQLSLDLLEKDESITLEEMKDYKFTPRVFSAERLKADLVAALEGPAASDAELKEASDLLKAWDNTVAGEARGAVLFTKWLTLYKGKTKTPFAKPWSAEDPFNTPSGIGDPAAAAAAMKQVRGEVIKYFGRIDPVWSEVTRIRRGKLNLPGHGGTGDFGFFRILYLQETPKELNPVPGERMAVGGDSFVLGVEFTDPPRAWSVVAYGPTEREDSPHFGDQTEMFSRHEVKPVRFTEADVKAAAKRVYHPGE